MNARKLNKTKLFFFQKHSNFEFGGKIDELKALEFVEQFMMNTFMLKLTQFEKTGSIGKTSISLGNLIINFHFRNQNSITFFVTFTLLLFDSRVCQWKCTQLEKNHISNSEKLKLSENKF